MYTKVRDEKKKNENIQRPKGGHNLKKFLGCNIKLKTEVI